MEDFQSFKPQELDIPDFDKEAILVAFFEHVSMGKGQYDFVHQFNQHRPAHVPKLHLNTVRRWISRTPELIKDYELAKKFSADSSVDEIIPIADACVTMIDAAIAKTRIDARKWVAAKYHNKAYGERVESVHSLADGSKPLSTITVTQVPRGEFVKHDDEDDDLYAESLNPAPAADRQKQEGE